MTKQDVIREGADTAIATFRDDYRWLSNFWPAAVSIDGVRYPSVENAFQAAKAHPEDRSPFVQCSAAHAKRLGRTIAARSDWLEIRVAVMRDLLQQKFAPGTSLAQQLIATGQRPLVEGNTWGDTFWGVSRGVGSNLMGELLMAQRATLQALAKKGYIRVGSKRQGGTRPEPDEIPIHGDRQSPVFGNPFPLKNWMDHRERDAVIERFFVERFAPDVLKKGPIFEAMTQLAQRVNDGENLILMCWCAPLKCHCQHIAKGVEILAQGEDLQDAVVRSLAHRTRPLPA